MKNNIRLPLIIIMSFIMLAACSKKKLFEKHIDIDNYSWHRVDGNHMIKFDVPVEDTVSDYNINIAVRYMTGFPFTDLHVGMNVNTPDGEEKYSTYTLELRGKDGSYKGEGLGDLWDLTVPVIKKYRFNHKGLYKFEVENLMDKYDTPGIMQIGLIINKIK